MISGLGVRRGDELFHSNGELGMPFQQLALQRFRIRHAGEILDVSPIYMRIAAPRRN